MRKSEYNSLSFIPILESNKKVIVVRKTKRKSPTANPLSKKAIAPIPINKIIAIANNTFLLSNSILILGQYFLKKSFIFFDAFFN